MGDPAVNPPCLFSRRVLGALEIGRVPPLAVEGVLDGLIGRYGRADLPGGR